MLRGLHKASSNWLGRIVMAGVLGLIVVSFAIWGIGDIFRGFGVSTVAQVGHTDITIDQFRRQFDDALRQRSQQLGRPISPDQARALGFDRQLLAQMLAEAALDERARDMRLGISNAAIAERITKMPAFLGPTGQFDRTVFEQRIHNANYTEQRFVSSMRTETVRNQLLDTIRGGVKAPQVAVEAVNRYRNEQRNIQYVVLDRANAGDIAAPTPEVLAKYYDEHKTVFRAPEFRKLNVVVITPATIAGTIEVPEEDVKRAYEAHLSRYTTAERRDVQRIVFPSEDEARKASERLAGGLTYSALAAERGLKEADFDLGLVAKSDISDHAIADAAFSLKQDGVSAPVTTASGAALVHVTKIEPEHTRPLSEVAPEIKRELSLDRAKDQVSDVYNKIEDQRAAGSTLDEAAQKLKVPVRTIDAIDRSGHAPDGSLVANLPNQAELLGAAFSSEVGAETDPLQTADGGYVWYEVVSINPSHDRSLEEVKDKVEARWRDDEVVKRLTAKASEMADKLKSGSTLADIARTNQLKLETATGVKRSSSKGLSSDLVEAVFRTAGGAGGTAEGSQPTQRIIFRVTSVDDPAFDPKSTEAQTIDLVLTRQIENDLYAQYVEQVKNELGTTINPTAFTQAVGGGSSPN